jgi:uncharacterized protein YqgC (DUF456 family)
MFLAVLCWLLIAILILAGFLGSFLPILPGTPLILAGVFLYNFCEQRLLMHPERALSAGSLWGFVGLVVLAHLVDFAASLVGANRYGASRSGVWGGVIGLGIGVFFSLPGLLLGPLVGVVVGELLAGKAIPIALRAAWGTLVGTAAGTVARVSIAFIMVVWFVVAAWMLHAG